jgi:hypothetical protein
MLRMIRSTAKIDPKLGSLQRRIAKKGTKREICRSSYKGKAY